MKALSMFRHVFFPTAICAALAVLFAPSSSCAEDAGDIPPGAVSSSMPQDERDLLALFAAAGKDYAARHADMRAQDIRLGLQVHVIEALRRNSLAQGWTGIVESRGLTPEGDAWVSIRIGDAITLSTWKTKDEDATATTLFKPGSKLFAVAQNAKVGQPIKFSGYVLLYLNEPDEDMILRPNLIMFFTDLTPA
jgi:hypothetical protein